MMKKALYLLVAILCIVLFAWLVISSNEWNSNRSFESFVIKGNSILDSTELLKNYQTKVENKKIDSINLSQIEIFVEDNPYVREVEAFRDGSDIRLEITENYPEAYVVLGKNLMLLDSDFNLMPFRSIDNYTDLPVVRVKSQFELNNTKHHFVELFQSLNSDEGGLIRKLVSEVWQDGRNIKLTLNQNGVLLILDKNSNLQKQYKNFNRFWNSYLQGKISDEFTKVDLRWENRVVIS